MKKGKFKAVIYLVSFTVILTVGIQVYRNIQNYQQNKQQLINDVQLSLDNAIEAYYADLAKGNDYFRVITSDSINGPRSVVSGAYSGWVNSQYREDAPPGHEHNQTDSTNQVVNGAYQGWVATRNSGSGPTPNRVDSILRHFNQQRRQASGNSSLKFTLNNNSIRLNDSLITLTDSSIRNINPRSITGVTVFNDTASNLNVLNNLANSLVISMVRPLEMDSLSSYVKDQLMAKGLNLDFGLQLTSVGEVIDEYNSPEDERFILSTQPKDTYEHEFQKLEMRYTDVSMATLKRGLTDLIISLLISVTVIGALLYLYRVINRQKQLAEIKNDLISNITHEFKTPIATVSSALEGIANFNEQNDPAKTRKYLDMSTEQLKKLNLMVEKLLETATLETDALELNRRPMNLSQVLHSLIEKYRVVCSDKNIHFEDHAQDAIIEADTFHLENALSNLIDNAVKYGGDEIMVSLAHQQNTVQVVVQDNGGFIEKSQKEKVFDKFYRIPKGNQHDVKGFGIGLYYTRKIIEKHGGSIELILRPGQTSFEIAI